MKKIVLFLLIFAFPQMCKGETLFNIESGPEQISLVELFSSEGCSSCPPAEAWLNQLKDRNGLWKKFVPVAFHVHYWDYIGWKDKFASTEYTARQKEYVRLWQGRTLYTPCMVLNGREYSGWRTGQVPGPSNETTGILKVKETAKNLFEISFVPSHKKNANQYQVHAVLLGLGITSNVTRGENRNRVLKHDFVVLEHVEQSLSKMENGYQATLSIPGRKEPDVPHYALAFWVNREDDLTPVQALGGPY